MSRQPLRRVRMRSRGGTLLLVASLMIGSALVRFGVEAGPAIAKEAERRAETQPTFEAPEWSVMASADMTEVLRAFQERETTLRAQERDLEERLKAVGLAETAIDLQLAALLEAESKLRATLAMAEGASEADLSRLTTVYENMKPKQAAPLFEAMAPEFAAGFLARMRPEAAAGIMAGLSPPVAYSISAVLAGRNFSVPKQ